MANEMEPSEPDLRNIRKHLRQGTSARGVLGWGGLALLALSALVLTSQTQGGSERLQQALAAVANDPAPVAVKAPEPVRTATPRRRRMPRPGGWKRNCVRWKPIATA